MADDRLKYFDLLQAATSRMATNSFLLKGWSVTLTSAILGLAARDAKAAMALVALVPVLALWGLDGYFLALERKFRKLWEDAIKAAAPSFVMSPGPLALGDWIAALGRPAVWGLHLPLGLAAVAAYLQLR
ncbi:MAG: hypothetical protein JF614_03555 [Acidobacteria bacterium]|jgi:hypothetical protein|nr:hypothetical protein [Acidobacteriota bacterium]